MQCISLLKELTFQNSQSMMKPCEFHHEMAGKYCYSNVVDSALIFLRKT